MSKRLTIFKSFVCHLQKYTLLRIHGLSLTGGDGEKWCIEVGNVALDKVTTLDARLDIVRFKSKVSQRYKPTIPFLSPLG